MDTSLISLTLYGAGAAGLSAALVKAKRRLDLSFAKHRSLAGHARMSRRVAGLLPYYAYGADRFFRADDAPPDVASSRQAAFERLAADYAERFPETIRLKAEAKSLISDLQFTDAYRVPFQFSRRVQDELGGGVFLRAASGVTLNDVDGNAFYDLAGSYGVNLLGYDFYKSCIENGARRVADLGPVLGAYHPAVVYNARRLKEISGLDEVSFHLSGTEAVMQAVRLARYHTGRPRVVRFCGAYHGWWGDVQPGVGNPLPARDTYTLAEMSEQTLRVLATRRDIACVLVNPLQALHPNGVPPADSGLVDSTRKAVFDRQAYGAWLQKLRAVCTQRGIVLILDEIFVGFRIALGGAQEYFGVKADMVTYGKTLGGGLPVGVVCGTRDLMKRFRDDRPADVCLARGTFAAHPYVMGAMQEFLERIETPQFKAIYHDLDATWTRRTAALNARLAENGLPVQVATLSSIWTILYTVPSRYNWMFQYYLRREGLALSWVGSGRLIFSLNYTDENFEAVCQRFIAAARSMHADGWWWKGAESGGPSIKWQLLREMIAERLGGR